MMTATAAVFLSVSPFQTPLLPSTALDDGERERERESTNRNLTRAQEQMEVYMRVRTASWAFRGFT